MIGSWRQLFRPPAWVSAFGTRFMPFADAASAELPLGRLLRLSLFQYLSEFGLRSVCWLVFRCLLAC